MQARGGRRTVDGLLLAGDVVAEATPRAAEAVAAVPPSADALAQRPCLPGGRDRDDVADDFVAWDAGVLDGDPEGPRSDRVVTGIRVSSEIGS